MALLRQKKGRTVSRKGRKGVATPTPCLKLRLWHLVGKISSREVRRTEIRQL